MSAIERLKLDMTRRHFFGAGGNLLGTAAMASLAGGSALGSAPRAPMPEGVRRHLPARAKHVIYLHMVGG
ncbi:MAG: sulfatase, partial [Planctomycetales bacterium]|nr:sulfatase [Planctomycetales bacterium]